MAQNFSKAEALRFGWDKMKANFWLFTGVLLFMVLISGLTALYETLGDKIISNVLGSNIVMIIFHISTNLISWVLSMIMGMGLMKIILKVYDNEKAVFFDLFSCIHLFFKYLFGSVLYILIIIGGLCLLIVPGIIWGMRFFFCYYFIIDKEMGPIQSLRKSSAITKGSKWNLFLFLLLIAAINLLGVLCLFVGLLATVPMTSIAVVYVYRKLLSQAEAGQMPSSVPQ